MSFKPIVTMSALKSVAVITFSTRTPRVGPEVAAFVKEVIEKDAKDSGLQLSPVDLKDFNLPIFDESVIPGGITDSGAFAHQHSIAWSKEISKHAAYIAVIPEYNFGLAGGTKNAVDYLKHEWTGKPVAIVSYGIQGGKTANAQLQNTLNLMKLRVAATRPALAFDAHSGPEMELPMLKGQIGPKARERWTEKESGEILKAFGELKELLAQEPPTPEKH